MYNLIVNGKKYIINTELMGKITDLLNDYPNLVISEDSIETTLKANLKPPKLAYDHRTQQAKSKIIRAYYQCLELIERGFYKPKKRKIAISKIRELADTDYNTVKRFFADTENAINFPLNLQ